jgi:hypothetical protein
MRVAHHIEPLIGRRLAVAVEDLPDAVDEDLRTAAGNAVEAAAIRRSITAGTGAAMRDR